MKRSKRAWNELALENLEVEINKPVVDPKKDVLSLALKRIRQGDSEKPK